MTMIIANISLIPLNFFLIKLVKERNEKIKTTDEFLVEKRDPLVFPPDFEKIPVPGVKEEKKISEEEKIKKLFKVDEQKNVYNSNYYSVEDSILKKIHK